MKWLDLLWQWGLHPLQLLWHGANQLRIQLLRSMFMLAMAAVCGGMALALVTLTILLLCWENYRYQGLAALTMTFTVMGVVFGRQAHRGMRLKRRHHARGHHHAEEE
jgi:uncharacterized membrane protein YqjE